MYYSLVWYILMKIHQYQQTCLCIKSWHSPMVLWGNSIVIAPYRGKGERQKYACWKGTKQQDHYFHDKTVINTSRFRVKICAWHWLSLRLKTKSIKLQRRFDQITSAFIGFLKSQLSDGFRRASRILKWGVNFCNNIIEPKPGWGKCSNGMNRRSHVWPVYFIYIIAILFWQRPVLHRARHTWTLNQRQGA